MALEGFVNFRMDENTREALARVLDGSKQATRRKKNRHQPSAPANLNIPQQKQKPRAHYTPIHGQERVEGSRG